MGWVIIIDESRSEIYGSDALLQRLILNFNEFSERLFPLNEGTKS
jgi:hypothetical protein